MDFEAKYSVKIKFDYNYDQTTQEEIKSWVNDVYEKAKSIASENQMSIAYIGKGTKDYYQLMVDSFKSFSKLYEVGKSIEDMIIAHHGKLYSDTNKRFPDAEDLIKSIVTIYSLANQI